MRKYLFVLGVFYCLSLLATPKKLVLACLGCSGDETVYQKLSDLYFPKDEIEWVLIPNSKSNQLAEFLKEKKEGEYVFEGTRLPVERRKLDSVIKELNQPNAQGKKFYLQTYTYNGETKATGLAEAFQFSWQGSTQYLVFRSESLFSDVGKQLSSRAATINERMQLVNGPAHLQFTLDEASGQWSLSNYSQGILGNGNSEVEREVWGTNQQVLHLLRILDEKKFLDLWSTFPRHRYRDSLIFAIPSAVKGTVNENALLELAELKTLRWPSPFFVPSPNQKVNTKTPALTLRLVGHTNEIQGDFETAYRLLVRGYLITPQAHERNCSHALSRTTQLFETIDRTRAAIRWNYRP